MVKSSKSANRRAHRKNWAQKSKKSPNQAKNLAAMCKISAEIINQLYKPIDATNRFINLALQSIDDDAQSRQFLIESKQGIRKTSLLLNKLSSYTDKIKKEIHRMGEIKGWCETDA